MPNKNTVDPPAIPRTSQPPTEAGPKAQPRPKLKRRVSRGLKRAEELDHGMAKVSSRLSKAIARGFNSYHEERDRSAEKRRNGAIRDFPENVARGVGNSVRVASRAPLDLAKSVDTKPATKRVRKAMRSFLRPFSR